MRSAFNSGRRQLNEAEERLLEKSLESTLALEVKLNEQRRVNGLHVAEKAEILGSVASAFGQGASAAASRASEASDRCAATNLSSIAELLQTHSPTLLLSPTALARLSERATELMREYQRKTLHMNRTDPEVFMRMLQLQSSFLEGLDRRLVQCREKVSAPTVECRPSLGSERPCTHR